MKDTITASQVQRLNDALDSIDREIDLLGTQVAAASPYSLVLSALRREFRALDMTAHDLHTHLAKCEADAVEEAEREQARRELQQQYPDGVHEHPDA